ncbi:MAG: hypothetical protein ACT4PE_00765 [Candidatus Eiseniibacteriota bacterium]
MTWIWTPLPYFLAMIVLTGTERIRAEVVFASGALTLLILAVTLAPALRRLQRASGEAPAA